MTLTTVIFYVSPQGRRVLPRIFGGGVRLGSSNPDAISDQNILPDLASKFHTHFQTWFIDSIAVFSSLKCQPSPPPNPQGARERETSEFRAL